MNKNNNLSKELPDYIRGNISDGNLKSEIENELINNPAFTEEYNRLKEIIYSLDNPKIDDVPENYFLNLSNRIFNRLDSEKEKNPRNIIDKYFLNWKFAAAAAVVIIFMLIVKPFSGSFNKINEYADSVTKTKNTVVQNDEQNNYNAGIENYYDEIEEIQGDFSLNGNNAPFGVRNFNKQNINRNKTDLNVHNNKENVNELYELLVPDSDDESELPSDEDIFLKLSPDEQNDVIKQIKNLKI